MGDNVCNGWQDNVEDIFGKFRRMAAGNTHVLPITDVTTFLDECEADISDVLDYGDDDGCNLLHLACTYSGEDNVKIAEILLNKGCPVDCEDNDKRTPLYFSCANGQADCIQLLLKHQADVNHLNNFGSTPLHFACANGQLEAVKVLLDSGADVKIRNNGGYTALDYAKRGGEGYSDPKIVKIVASMD